MKLLFDQNLSPSLSGLLAEIYPGSVHIREIGMRDATDSEIWEYAKTNGFAIVSKDSDFQARSLLYGSPQNLSGYESGIVQSKPSRNYFERIRPPFKGLRKMTLSHT